MMKKIASSIIVVLCLFAVSLAEALELTSGADTTAAVYGSVKYRDFGNNNNEWDIGLMDYRVSTTVPRINKTFYGTNGLWGTTNTFEFVYLPLAGIYDKISTKVDVTGGTAQTYNLEWATLPDPANTINYLQFSVRDIDVSGQPTDAVTMEITDLAGQTLATSTFTADNSYQNWYIADASLFANGFIVKGNINLTGNFSTNINEKNELVEIKFGNTSNVPVVPEPISSTLFLVGAATLGFRRFRRNVKG